MSSIFARLSARRFVFIHFCLVRALYRTKHLAEKAADMLRFGRFGAGIVRFLAASTEKNKLSWYD
jgi:hypothetical protein